MELAVGALIEGKITGITKFGAFVSLDQGKTGLVHISEVSHTYVNDINEHLKEGQDVKVKIIGIDDSGRVNLSIKKTTESAPKTFPRNSAPDKKRTPYKDAPPVRRNFSNSNAHERKNMAPKEPPTPENVFEDKLKMFMQDSESRMADIKHNIDKKSGRRRR